MIIIIIIIKKNKKNKSDVFLFEIFPTWKMELMLRKAIMLEKEREILNPSNPLIFLFLFFNFGLFFNCL